LMPSQCRFNAQYFVEQVMEPLVQTVFPQGWIRYTPQLNVHFDNCRVHFSKVMEQFSAIISCCMFRLGPVGLLAIQAYQDWTHWPKVRRALRIIRRCSRISGGNSYCGIDGGFRGLD
jgi:hypothetical protein